MPLCIPHLLCGGEVLALSAVLLAALLCGARERGGLQLLPCLFLGPLGAGLAHLCQDQPGELGQGSTQGPPSTGSVLLFASPVRRQRDQRAKGTTRSFPREPREQGAGWWHSAVCPESFVLCCWGTGCACHSGQAVT